MTGEGRSRQVLAGGLAVKAGCIGPEPLMPARSGTASHVRLVRIVLPFRKDGVPTDNSNTTRTIVPASPPKEINSGATRMANHSDPLEILSFELAAEQRRYLAEAKADGTVDAFERSHYSALGRFAERTQSLSALRKLSRHIENGQPLTDYSHRLAAHAGIGLVDLDAERRAREGNIVPFPSVQEIG